MLGSLGVAFVGCASGPGEQSVTCWGALDGVGCGIRRASRPGEQTERDVLGRALDWGVWHSSCKQARRAERDVLGRALDWVCVVNREIVRGISPRLQSLNALRARRPTGVFTPIKNLTRSPQRQAWGDRAR